jgi:hypothetical protein
MDFAGMMQVYRENLRKVKSLNEQDIKETVYFYSEMLCKVFSDVKEVEKIAEITRSNIVLDNI